MTLIDTPTRHLAEVEAATQAHHDHLRSLRLFRPTPRGVIRRPRTPTDACYKPVEAVDSNGAVKHYPSIAAASAATGETCGAIGRAVRSGKMLAGVVWRAAEV